MFTRRRFVHFASAALSGKAFAGTNSMQQGSEPQQTGNPETLWDRYPAYAPDLIEKIVTVAHFSLDKVKEVVEPHPQLVKAAIDWGFGDWETPLGAACHMGRKDIATYLLSNGATPSLFRPCFLGICPGQADCGAPCRDRANRWPSQHQPFSACADGWWRCKGRL